MPRNLRLFVRRRMNENRPALDSKVLFGSGRQQRNTGRLGGRRKHSRLIVCIPYDCIPVNTCPESTGGMSDRIYGTHDRTKKHESVCQNKNKGMNEKQNHL